MKQLRLSTLSLCCLTAIMSPSVFAEEIKPLLQEGKTTLYQRVLSTPSCELLAKSDAKSGQKIPAFSRYYVYKRENIGNKALLQVGPDSFGKTVGWLDANCAVPWNMQMTMVFTNPSDRGSLRIKQHLKVLLMTILQLKQLSQFVLNFHKRKVVKKC